MFSKSHVAFVKTNHFFQQYLIEELKGKEWRSSLKVEQLVLLCCFGKTSNEFVFFSSEWYDSEIVLAGFNHSLFSS